MVNKNRNASRLIRPNEDRANLIVIVFVVMIVMSILSGINSLMLYSKFDGTSYSEMLNIQHSGHFTFLLIFSVLSFLLFVVSAITFLNWFRRAYFNLHLFTEKKLSYSEDMAVWGFMIPFINLVRPFTIATEIYDGTHTKAAELTNNDVPKNDSIISIWWILFVFLGIVSTILVQIGGEDSLEEIIQSMYYLGIADLLDVPRLIAAIFMVKAVSKVESIVYRNKLGLDEPVVSLESISEEE